MGKGQERDERIRWRCGSAEKEVGVGTKVEEGRKLGPEEGEGGEKMGCDHCVERLPRRGVYTGILGAGNIAEG